eukprot:TRINITY_DN12071_c0_g1_i3.p1 TRINITY_DN12071_c0_g1~~TRINITY_DN12071_c0_g1_i3.p1  ORF type:complete len:233 (+),score=42.58 TRINITY_DN12071_c0_g1_i3:30-701(+)
MGQEQSANLDEVIFNLKMTGKQLERHSKKAEKEMAKNKAQVKKYLEKGNPEAARVYAENAIRKKSECTNFLRMAARIDATVSRVQSAQQMKTVRGFDQCRVSVCRCWIAFQITKSMGGVVKGMDKAMASMDLEQIAGVMDKFESQFEELDVRTGVLDSAMTSANASSMPEDQVDSLMAQIADENHLEVAAQFADPSAETAAVPQASAQQEDELTRRLAELRAT